MADHPEIAVQDMRDLFITTGRYSHLDGTKTIVGVSPQPTDY